MNRVIRLAVGMSCFLGAACSTGDEVTDPSDLEDDGLAAEGDESSDESVPLPVWGECPPFEGIPDVGQECAKLLVPLDYRAPNGRQMEVAISRVRTATPLRRRGVLLLNPGGPGAQGLRLGPAAAIVFPRSILDQYDVVGFDPRGVGRSSPLSCGLVGLQTQLLVWDQPGGFTATADLARSIAEQCARQEGDRLAFMTSNNTVRDMDRIRQALRADKIAYYGGSGGTNLGAIYAAMFPDRTDRFVLDSALDPFGIWRGDWRRFGSGGELRFPDLAAFVAANDATYHLGATPAVVRAVFADLLADLEADPIVLSNGVPLSGGLLRLFIFTALYNDANFPFAAELLQRSRESPPDVAAIDELIATRAAQPTPGVPLDNYPSVHFANLCDDVRWSHSVAQYKTEYDADRAANPLFGGVGSNIHPCAFWPIEPIEPLTPITPRGPSNILITQNLRDPATPHAGALELRRALGDRSRMVTVDQGGHGAFPGANQCVNNVAADFLATGVLPRSDVFCPSEATAAAPPGGDTVRDRALRALRGDDRVLLP